MNKDYKKSVEKKLSLNDNKTCVDCNTRNPRWVSLRYGIFLCLDCAGLHRSLGVYLDFIKSATLDIWDEEAFLPIKYGGNGKFREYLQLHEVAEEDIPSKYMMPIVIGYSKQLMNEIKEKTGSELKYAQLSGNGCSFSSSSKDTLLCNSSLTENVSIPNKQQYNNSFLGSKMPGKTVNRNPHSSVNNSQASSKFSTNGSIVSNIKNSISEYSPKIASISSTTISHLSELTNSLSTRAKVFGSKTMEMSSKFGGKMLEEARNMVSGHSNATTKKSIVKKDVPKQLQKVKKDAGDWS